MSIRTSTRALPVASGSTADSAAARAAAHSKSNWDNAMQLIETMERICALTELDARHKHPPRSSSA
jgi:hypothetical protein